MSTTSSRGAVRRARIARQHLQLHDTLSLIVQRRLIIFWRAVRDDVTFRISQAHSTAVYVDQIYDGREWEKLFNNALIPSLRTSIDSGMTFEQDWIEAATATKTLEKSKQKQGIDEQSGSELFVIQHCQNYLEFSENFSGNRVIQKDVQPQFNFLPDISVQMSEELQKQTERFLDSRRVGIWSKVNDTTRKTLARVIQQGLKDGDTINQLTARVQSVLTQYGQSSAARVARTEVTAAMNWGGHCERIDLGIAHKEWVSTIDSRNRGAKKNSHYDHLTCSGQTVESDKPFIVSGEQLQFPGDISLGATPGNLIHCRCTAVGAWPTGALAGSGFKASLNPQVHRLPETTLAMNKANDDRNKLQFPQYYAEQIAKGLQSILKETEALRRKLRIQSVPKDVRRHHEELQKLRQACNAFAKTCSDIDQEIKRLKRAANPDQKKIQALIDKKIQALIDKRNQTYSTYESNLNRARAHEDAIRNYTSIILKADDPTSIDLIASGVATDSAQMKSANAAKAWLDKVLDKKAVNGQDSVRVIVEDAGNRAYYSNGVIALGDNLDPATAAHEIGHHIESHGTNQYSGVGFLKKRTEGYGDVKSLAEDFPANKFRSTEVYWDDEFRKAFPNPVMAAYAGKYYNGFRATEIISMGVELLFSNPLAFARSDPEFCRFIIGVLRGHFVNAKIY